MKYADSSLCPSCRTERRKEQTCSTCGLDFTAPALSQVWAGLVSVDQWLARAREESRRVPTASFPENFPAPAPRVSVKPPVKIDAGSVLLLLGALFILVAGSIVSALALGVFALPLMTLVSGLLAYVAFRKDLRASTETLIGITGLLAGFSVGIFAWDSTLGTFIWSLMGLASGFTFLYLTREQDFKVPQVLLGLCVLTGAGSLGVLVGENLSGPTGVSPAWASLTAFVFAAVLALASFKLDYKIGAFAGATVAAGAGLIFASSSHLALLLSPELNSITSSGLPIFVLGLTLATAGVSWGLRAHGRGGPALLALGVFHLLYLTWVPTFHESPKLVIGLGLIFALSLSLWASNHWASKALRSASVPFALLATGLLAVALLASATETLERLTASSHLTWNERLKELDPSWYLFVLAALILSTYVYSLSRWPLYSSSSRPIEVAGLTLAIQLPLLACVLSPTPFTLCLSLTLSGKLAVLSARRFSLPSLAFLIASPLPALLHAGLLGLTCLYAGLLIVGLAVGFRKTFPAFEFALGVGGLYALSTPALWSIQSKESASTTTLLLLLSTLLALAVGAALRRRGLPGSLGLEGAGLILGLGALSGSTEVSTSFTALIFLLLGAPIIVVGLLDSSRAKYRLIGSSLLGLAWILRLVASDVETPEAYTGPFALALLLVGLHRLMKTSESSWALLGPGVSLALIPSLPWILQDPVSLRAVIITVLALGFLAWGARASLAAPFITAALVLALIAPVELGPYVLGLHRWVLLGSVGVLLALAGATWEARVKDGRAVVKYLSSLK